MPRTAGHTAAPYGYRLETRTEVHPVPEEQAVLFLIAKLRRDGRSLQQIADQLDALGLRTRSGGKFSKNTVHGVCVRERIPAPAGQLADTG